MKIEDTSRELSSFATGSEMEMEDEKRDYKAVKGSEDFVLSISCVSLSSRTTEADLA